MLPTCPVLKQYCAFNRMVNMESEEGPPAVVAEVRIFSACSSWAYKQLGSIRELFPKKTVLTIN